VATNAPAQGQSAPDRYRYAIDARASRFTVQAFAGGFGAMMAHDPKFAIREFEGLAEFAPDSLSGASLRVTLKPASLELLDDVGEKDRAEILRVTFEETLETSRFPEIVFESTQVAPTSVAANLYRVVVTGNLTLHGATRSQSIPAQAMIAGEMLRANGEFTLNQSDYGIKRVSVAGGVIKVKDELKLTFDLVARKQA
jgi:polyisoprenoid-binding protein YceI